MGTVRIVDVCLDTAVCNKHLHHMLVLVGSKAEKAYLLALERFQSMRMRKVNVTRIERRVVAFIPGRMHPRRPNDIQSKCHRVLILVATTRVAYEMGDL